MELKLLLAVVAVHFVLEVVLGNSAEPAFVPVPAEYRATPRKRLTPREFATRLLPMLVAAPGGLWLLGLLTPGS